MCEVDYYLELDE